MGRYTLLFVALLGLVLLATSAPGDDKDSKVRNPFEVADVEDPEGDDVKNFAKDITLAGDDQDRNAEQWVETETAGKADSLDGEWSSRWEGGSGTAKVKVVKDRVYALYTDQNATWLLEAIKEDKGRLVGRWVQVGSPNSQGPFVGKIVNGERIDGSWGQDLRWDFRRKLKK